jgi:PIN domain nuclease of toxin-antitoxin system
LLLDTHVLIWSVTEPQRLREELRHTIIDPNNEVYVSIVSLWEILIKARVGKLKLRLHELEATLLSEGFSTLALAQCHLEALEKLQAHHRDPFDHLLLAQAIAEDLTFVSEDRHASAYPVRLMRC